MAVGFSISSNPPKAALRVGVAVAPLVVALPVAFSFPLPNVSDGIICVKFAQFSLVPFAACMTTDRFPKKASLLGSVLTYNSKYLAWKDESAKEDSPPSPSGMEELVSCETFPCLPLRSPGWHV